MTGENSFGKDFRLFTRQQGLVRHMGALYTLWRHEHSLVLFVNFSALEVLKAPSKLPSWLQCQEEDEIDIKLGVTLYLAHKTQRGKNEDNCLKVKYTEGCQ